MNHKVTIFLSDEEVQAIKEEAARRNAEPELFPGARWEWDELARAWAMWGVERRTNECRQAAERRETVCRGR